MNEIPIEDVRVIVASSIERAYWLADQNRFDEANKALKRAYKFAKSDSSLSREVENAERDILSQREDRERMLRESCERMLEKSPDMDDSDFARCRQIVDELRSLGANAEADDLEHRINRVYQEIRRLQQQRIDEAITRAKELARNKSFSEAFDTLFEVQVLAKEQGKNTRLLAVARQIERKRISGMRVLEAELKSILDKDVTELSDQDFAQATGLLHALQHYLLPDFPHGYLALCPEDEREEKEQCIFEEDAKFELLQKRLWAVKQAREDHLRFVETKRLVEEIWKKPKLFVDDYKRALNLCRKQQRSIEDPHLEHLAMEARERYDEAQSYVDDLLQKAEAGDFQPLMDEYKRLRKAGYASLPALKKESDGLVLADFLPASEALKVIRILAQEAADNMAEEYRRQAEALVNTDAEEAGMLIEKALALPYLTRPRRRELNRYLRDQVKPVQERQKEARKLVAKARQLHDEEKYIEAWMSVSQALELAPELAEAKRFRTYLTPWIKIHFGTRIRNAEESFRDGKYEQAQEDAELVLLEAPDISAFQALRERARMLLNKIHQK